MSNPATPTDAEVATAADEAADACLMFEVCRRRIHKHLNWTYSLPLPERSARREGLIWAQLFGDCQTCHGRHVKISKKAYNMWHAYCPFVCYHKSVVDTIRFQPDEVAATMYPEMPLPDKVQVAEVDTASKSSGGRVTSTKLKKDLARVRRDGPKAIELLRKSASKARLNPEAGARFPEAAEELVMEKIMRLEEQQEELENALEDQIVAKQRIEEDRLDEEDSVPPPAPGGGGAGTTASQATPTTSVLTVTTAGGTAPSSGAPIPTTSTPPSTTMTGVSGSSSTTITCSGGTITTDTRLETRVLGTSTPLASGGLASLVSPLNRPSLAEELRNRQVRVDSGGQILEEGAAGNQRQHLTDIAEESANLTAMFSELHARALQLTGRLNIPDGVETGDQAGVSALATGITSNRRARLASLGLQREEAHTRDFLLTRLQEDEERVRQRQTNSVSSSRQSGYEYKITNLKKEVLSLASTVKKVREKPSWEGLKFIRARKGVVEEKHAQVLNSWDKFLEKATDQQLESPTHQDGQYALQQLESQLESLEEEVAACELEVAGLDPHQEASRPQQAAFLERLSLPKFSGQPQLYPDFRALFKELTKHMKSDTAVLEYLRRAMPDKYQALLKGISTTKEAWSRLDERFADRVGQIRTVLKHLHEAELGAGKGYEKIERLDQEVSHASYLLRGLKAENKLVEDLNLVNNLVKKLSAEQRREWVKWSAELSPEPIPGESEWPHFVKWVKAQRKSALKERWLDEGESSKSSVSKVSCRRCGSHQHKHGECPKQPTTSLLNQADDMAEAELCEEVLYGEAFASKEAQEAAYQKAAKRVGKCPDCKVLHTLDKPMQGGKTIKWPSDQWRNCPQFMAMSSVDKAARIERAKGCPKCTSWGHQLPACRVRRPDPCRQPVANGLCDRLHHVSLHDSKNQYCNANPVVNVSINSKGQMILLGVQQVHVETVEGDKTAILFYDSGSTLTLCTHSWARSKQLQGDPVTIYLKVLGGEYKAVDTCQYRFKVKGHQGEMYEVVAVGLDKLTREAPGGDLETAYSQFPDIPREQIQRPEGDVDILMGQDYAGHLPRVERSREHLLLLKSKFGSGRLISGRTGVEGDDICQHVLTSQAIDYGNATRKLPANATVNFLSGVIPNFMEAEDLVGGPPALCGLHRDTQHRCPDCRFRGEKISPREKQAVEMMEASIVKLESGRLRISYPFNEKAQLQQSNANQARTIQLRVEKTLKTNGIAVEFHEEIRKALKAGSLVKLEQEEIEQ